jgi:biotin synthase
MRLPLLLEILFDMIATKPNLRSLLSRDNLKKEDIVFLLSLEDPLEVILLYKKADEIRKECCGDEVHLRGIIEFSNNCEQDCLYCGLRISNLSLDRYRMSGNEILATAGHIYKAGIKTIVLQSGEDFEYSRSLITELVKSIKSKLDVAITLSLGERDFDDYDEWKKAGADRYLLKHETANPELYQKFHQKQPLEERVQHLRYLKSIGFQTGSGNMIGLPGQSFEDIADDLLLCKELDCDMVSISPFISSPDTPFKNVPNANLDLTLKAMAVCRIILKDVHIPATTALGTLDEFGREKGLQVGANVIMPNYTPNPYRQNYKIYPDKKCISDDPLACGSCLTLMIESLGRKVGTSKGHSLKVKEVV